MSKRVLLKLSGEAFGGGRVGVDPGMVEQFADELHQVVQAGIQVAVVTGGGNFFRGAELSHAGLGRVKADYMGMLGTVMNCLALQDACERRGLPTRVQTAVSMTQVAEPYVPLRAVRNLEKGRVVLLGAGAGIPYFSTDTAAAQRALELECEVLLMGKNGVAGVYDSDPRTNPDAEMYKEIGYSRILSARLAVADATAVSLCMENRMPMVVFDVLEAGNIERAASGERIGTLVREHLDREQHLAEIGIQ